jgi:hypothetical protein
MHRTNKTTLIVASALIGAGIGSFGSGIVAAKSVDVSYWMRVYRVPGPADHYGSIRNPDADSKPDHPKGTPRRAPSGTSAIEGD